MCLRDVPYIDVTFGSQPEFNGHAATVRFIDLDGNVVGTHNATFQAGTTVRFLYPGASVDANGNPTDWPGWLFDGDEWVTDPSDARLREGLTVVVDVNPTATGTVAYPPATPACAADPPQTPGGSSGGSSIAIVEWIAVGDRQQRDALIPLAVALVGSGLFVLFVRRRLADT